MNIDSDLLQRAESACELCGSSVGLVTYLVPQSLDQSDQAELVVCEICEPQMDNRIDLEPSHWRCLSNSMWSRVPAVQVVAWRVLRQLASKGELWAQELHETLYLEEATLAWAEAEVVDDGSSEDDATVHQDCHGVRLNKGDTVVLIKDLTVKGAGFTAKRGTAVRGISLVVDNTAQIEGRVEGQRIVILTEFVKKT